jgi:glycosyltransferase involved in cell wall biosynthesis
VTSSAELVAAAVASAPVITWLGVLLHPARAWDLRPIDDEAAPSPDPARWPPVAAIVPARNEAAVLPHTLPALLAQDYPGPWRVVLVDDRSADGTAELARRLAADVGCARRLEVVRGGPVPAGWVGKVWALEQGARRASRGPEVAHLLLTDADILHAPDSLRRLVAESEADGLALVSRMARLRCVSGRSGC